MKHLSTLRVIFFDAVGTLIYIPRGPAWHYCDVAARHGLSLDPAAAARAFGRVYRATPPPPVTFQPRPDDDRGWWRAIVDGVLNELGVPAGFPRGAYFEELFEEFRTPGPWSLYDEAIEILAALAPKYRLGIISNFDTRLISVLQHLGISHYFDPVIISSVAGAEKPHPSIFQQALRAANVPASAALHVGDDPIKDEEGGRAAGLQTFLLNRPTRTLRELIQLLNGAGENGEPKRA